jgi:hypothetical protein
VYGVHSDRYAAGPCPVWINGVSRNPPGPRSACFSCAHQLQDHRAVLVETWSTAGPFQTALPIVQQRGPL